jgi:hybrid cluster-associated redox disulfide protein
MTIDAHITVQELIRRHPGAIRFFMRHRMQCVGCPTEGFHTLAEVACIHGQTPERLLEEIAQVIDPAAASPSPTID